MKTTMMVSTCALLSVACDHSTPASRELAIEQARADPEAAVLEEVIEPVGEAAEVLWNDEPIFDPEADEDRDGFAADVDVDDRDPFTHPGARDEPCDGVDQDDDGIDRCPSDFDGDGIFGTADCDDGDPAVSPLAAEIRCNGLDENCDGRDRCEEPREGSDDGDADPSDEVR